ncbi:aliphatic nitrilase [Colletotrichum truncatum]|uniref:Aliphatic nitrilase n=1 Tax=Colletotrichum truncatum TaxID=5467 RepID=A0ACC3ZC49_COLTU|nr:aliphatic nitrilase [Colletotrichum truncatum]KAF6782249.1 aliphatic nitrilase [Colletotrichum truncatum]
MSASIVKVACTQAEPAWLDLAASVAKTCKLITEAASNGAQLIAFPECWIPGYPCWIWTRLVDFDLNVRYIKNSLSVNSPEMATIQACAKENNIAVSLGFSENDNNSLFIAQALIGQDGEMKIHRRKMKPTHMERTVFGDASGHCLQSVAELPFARVGSLACWEHIQPLLKYNTIAQKEEIHIAAWPSVTPHAGGPGLWSMSSEGCQTLSRTYAIESNAFVLHSTALITSKGVEAHNSVGGIIMSSPGGGTSAVFGPDGRRLTEPVDDTTEAIIYADLDMEMIHRTKMFADCTGHYSRPDLLRLLVDKEIKSLVTSQGEVEKGSVTEESALVP